MKARSFWIPFLLSVSIAACSKTEAKQSPTAEPAAKPVATEPAVAPAPVAAPAPTAPKTALTANETEAMALMKQLADGKVPDLNRLVAGADENERVVVFVNLSTKPQGGSNNIQKSYCPFDASGDGLEKLAKGLEAYASQIKQGFDDDVISCKEMSPTLVECTAPATMEGEATLGLQISVPSALIKSVYVYETWMIDDDARLAKDQKTIASAIKKLSAKECLSRAEADFKHDPNNGSPE